MQLYCILVPTKKNKPVGKNPYYTLRYHRLWDTKVRAITGGLTILSPAKGNWLSPSGELYVERVIPVQIACNQEQIEQIADLTAKHYSQLAIMYYRASDHVVIKHYESNQ
jgi:hypothetical protein